MQDDKFYDEVSEDLDKRSTMIEALRKIVKAFKPLQDDVENSNVENSGLEDETDKLEDDN